jgi:hypothetical protein
VKLQLRVVALKGPHLDNGGLFQKGESQLLTFDLCDSLHDLGQGVDDVYQVVALVVHSVDEGASLSEFGLKASTKNIEHEVWVWLITNLEDVVLSNYSKTCRSCLKVVKGISHITISSENEGFQTIVGILNSFLIHYDLESLEDLLVVELSEADNGAA